MSGFIHRSEAEADFLAAADAHAVDAADDGLVAGENRGNHVVEQPHVLAVLLGMAGDRTCSAPSCDGVNVGACPLWRKNPVIALVIMRE